MSGDRQVLESHIRRPGSASDNDFERLKWVAAQLSDEDAANLFEFVVGGFTAKKVVRALTYKVP
jgi:hypothetical protein